MCAVSAKKWCKEEEKQVRQLCLQLRNWVRPIVVARMGDFNKGWKREEYGLPRLGFPHSLVGKESECNAGDLGSIPGLERPPVEGNDNPLQYSWLENPMDRRAWQSTVYGVARVEHNWAIKHTKPRNASDKDPAYQCRRCKRGGFHTWAEKIPWRRT